MHSRFLRNFLFIGLGLIPTLLQSASYVVATPTFVQNGGAGNVMNGDDSLTITETGSITTVITDAVVATGSNNQILNEGRIQLDGSGLTGILINGGSSNQVINRGLIQNAATGINIFTSTNSYILNEGTIRTDANSADGFRLNGDSNVVISKGSIKSSGNNFFGFEVLGNSNTVINEGFVQADGTSFFGFQIVGDSNTVVNDGTVQLVGINGRAVNLEGTDNVFTNNGYLLGSDAFGRGIVATGATNGTVINTGTIGVREASIGIDNSSGNGLTITNSGRILSGGFAIDLGTADTLNLLAPSYLAGGLDLNTDVDLNFVTGPSHSVLWTFSGDISTVDHTISGPVPGFFNELTQQFATYDPTAFAALRDELADVSGAASLLVQTRLDGPCCAGPQTNVWISTFGSTYKYDGNDAILDYRYKYWGIVGGVDKKFGNNLTFGAFGGYGRGFSNADSIFADSYDYNAHGGIGAIYGRACIRNIFIDADISLGNLSHSNTRFVNDNLAPLGEASGDSSFDGFWVSPEIAIGTSMYFNGVTLLPNLRYRYAWESLDGFTESGLEDNATVAGQNISLGEVKVELAARGRFSFGCLWGRIGYFNRHQIGSNSVDVTLIDETLAVPSFYRNKNGGYLGLNAEMDLGGFAALNIGGELTAGSGMRGMKGEIALIKRF